MLVFALWYCSPWCGTIYASRKLKPKPAPGGPAGEEGAGDSETSAKPKAKPKPKPQPGAQQQDLPPPEKEQPKAQSQSQSQSQSQGGPLTEEQRMEAIFRLYGDGKAYPEPYLAGKVPRDIVHMRHKTRIEKTKFTYSVRFRTGPFGLSFDNRVGNVIFIQNVDFRFCSYLSLLSPLCFFFSSSFLLFCAVSLP